MDGVHALSNALGEADIVVTEEGFERGLIRNSLANVFAPYDDSEGTPARGSSEIEPRLQPDISIRP